MTADDVVAWANGQRPDVTAEMVAAWAGGLNHLIQTTQADAAASVAAVTADRDALAAQLAALATPPGAVLSVGEFTARLVPLQVCLAAGVKADMVTPITADLPALRAKWDRLTGMLAAWTTVDLRDPHLALLVGLAKGDGLLDDAGAAAVLAGG